MSVIISGDNGISDVDGSAGTPAIRGTDTNTGIFFGADIIGFAEGGTECARFNADAQFVAAAGTASLTVLTTTGDLNTGIFFPAADTIAFAEGGAEAMRIDSSGNVGIGTTTPGTRMSLQLSSATTYTTSTRTNQGLTIYNSSPTTNQFTGIEFVGEPTSGNGGFTGIGSVVTGSGSAALVFGTRDSSTYAERARIDSAGALILAGSTAQKATGTTWSNPSDQRLKDNIRDYNKGLAELMQVRVREWEYNGKGGTVEGTKGLGVVADEVMAVLPDTVENYEAKLNADDEEVTAIKKFDATEITWLLVKTVQELKAINDAQASRIETLEAKVAALEAK